MTLVGPLGLTVSDSTLEDDIRAGMATVEKLVSAATESPHPIVAETIGHLAAAGGKRFRPLLTMLTAQFGDPDAAGVAPAAAVVELTHLATLYHDDVMDEAQLRRGTASANARWGNTVAILAGDVLFAKASAILAELGSAAVRIHSATAERLVSGQLREVVGPAPGDDPIEHYLSVVADKTGALIATACRFGAMEARADENVTQQVTEFGEHIGMAFQIADDLLDVTGDPDDIGKVPGTDLREGVATLPVLYARASTREQDARLVELLRDDLTNSDARNEALELLRPHPALERARSDVRYYALRARKALESLVECPAKDALVSLCDVAAERGR